MNPKSQNLTPPTGSAAESRITAALEQKPEPQIPLDFAARVAVRAAAQPMRRRRYKPQFGRTIALLSAPIAVLTLFVLAPHAAPNLKSLSFDTEVVLLTELALIGWWIARTLNPQKSH